MDQHTSLTPKQVENLGFCAEPLPKASPPLLGGWVPAIRTKAVGARLLTKHDQV